MALRPARSASGRPAAAPGASGPSAGGPPPRGRTAAHERPHVPRPQPPTPRRTGPTSLSWAPPAAYPGVPDPTAFRENLVDGVESVQVIPAAPGAPADGRVRPASALPGIGDFDASFFGCSAREAELLHPQHPSSSSAPWR
ncbi:beta-ketoacyl synthase N-terminal-like domain-containing protein [Streptomyces tibetensis]|uniref:beta-ketoacyl synthase N-terminal-like domain-containing protein n=1 Tax=Streptomyces tibetensis TaxID=2382123 RepID=UPI0033F0E9CC